MPKTLNVLFLAAEAEPFVKVGGLGDVAGSLPRALRKLTSDVTGGVKLDVRLAMPLHAVVRTQVTTLRPVAIFSLPRSGGEVHAQAFETRLKGIPVYFIAGEPINAINSVYSSNPTLDGEKYTFFSLATLELIKRLTWCPDVVHANDWHSALAVYALRIRRWNGEFEGTASMLTVHNLPFMGPDVTGRLATYNLPLVQTDLPAWARAMPLPLGLWAADAIVAVSPSYAKEILTSEYGCGLEDFLRTRGESLNGILNGIDAQAYDPATDEALAARFTAETLADRTKNKAALQERLGLAQDPHVPLFAIISRMDPQKGIDLAFEAFRELTDVPWQAVILGSGDLGLEEAACRLQASLPDRVRAEMRYDARLARQIYAGADIFLIPSRYEPCGLTQMIAMRYGCVPVAHATGGLNDTVKPGQTGFLFNEPTPRALSAAMRKSLGIYSDHARWQELQRAGMAQDFSWAQSARQYFELYKMLNAKRK